jgi:peptidoglycan/xylan/chitin deacetylase (PgdA/CDA1 family)
MPTCGDARARGAIGGAWRGAAFGAVAVAALAAAAPAAVLAQAPRAAPVVSHPFPGLAGPGTSTPVLPMAPTPWQRYAAGAASRLAVLLTDTASAWLGLAHGLEAIGIPFLITRDAAEAVRHRVVFVYPEVSGSALSGDALRALVAFAHTGGTLIALDVLGGGLNEVFGFTEALPSRGRFEVRFGASPLTEAFTDPRERTVRLGDRARQVEALGTIGYTGVAAPVAAFDDGTAAIARRAFDGGGSAMALGVDVGALALLSHDGRDEFIAQEYANGYEPVLDVFLRLLKAAYLAGDADAVTLGTVPEGRPLAVLLTHDVDYRYSLANALAWAAFERERGVRATYFIQTKYVSDWADNAFFDGVAVGQVRTLDSLGMEIGSHSVAHARTFNTMPTGTGDERYPAYRPRVLAATRTEGATVLGELRVSRFLLERATGGTVASFRPGYLRNPRALPQALIATGLRFSSSFTADNVLTHLPLRFNWNREPGAETDVFDFPVTIEDEGPPPLLERLPAALALAGRLSAYGGTFVVLLHTNVIAPKLDFERALVDSLRGRAWFGTVGTFGRFWAARAAAGVDVAADGTARLVSLTLGEAADGLVVQAPRSWTLTAVEPAGAQAAAGPGGVVVTAGAGTVRLRFTVR